MSPRKTVHSKPFPYPRRVDTVHAEELTLRDNDVEYYSKYNASAGVAVGYEDLHSADADADAEAERRAAKRQRIEAKARAYLRGQSLYVASAQLRGPFNKNWKNPWSRKRAPIRSSVLQDERNNEIPETIKPNLAKYETSKEEGDSVIVATEKWLATKNTSQETPTRPQEKSGSKSTPSPPNAIVNDSEFSEDKPTPKAQNKEKRVEEWLRRNDAFVKQDIPGRPQSSPTPVVKLQAKIQVPRSFDEEKSAEQPEIGHNRIQQLSRAFHAAVDGPNVGTERRQGETSNAPTSKLQDTSRAEFAILNAKRYKTYLAPATDHTSPFEFKRVSEKGHHKDKSNVNTAVPKRGAITEDVEPKRVPFLSANQESNSDIVNDGKDGVQTDQVEHLQQRNLGAGKEVVDLQLSCTENPVMVGTDDPFELLRTTIASGLPKASTMGLITVDELPSAQKAADLPMTSSSGLLEVQLLDAKQSLAGLQEGHSNADATDAAEADKPWGLHAGTSDLSHDKDRTDYNSEAKAPLNPSAAHESTPISYSQVAKLNTQAMVDAISPFTLSTAKKAPQKKIKHDTPVTATRVKPTGKRKKTSFAKDVRSSDASQRSIEMFMSAKISKKLTDDPPLSSSKENSVLEQTPFEHNEQSENRPICKSTINSQNSTTKSDRGILKTAGLTNSQKLQRRWESALSTGEQQEGQGQKVLPSVGAGVLTNNDDTFDLDAAIDDLGSFLGSWDSEKEASGVVG